MDGFASIPRQGFEQRLQQLREQREAQSVALAVTDARIAEGEYWIATIAAIEAENTPQPESPPRRRKTASKGN
jgi:hypothetical protein